MRWHRSSLVLSVWVGGLRGGVIHFEDYGERQQFYLVAAGADVFVGMEVTESFLMLHATSVGYIKRSQDGWLAFFRPTKDEFVVEEMSSVLGWMWDKISIQYPSYVSDVQNGGSTS